MTVDYILRGGTVIDGTGGERYTADVAIKGDTVAMIGDLAGVQAAHELDVLDLIILQVEINHLRTGSFGFILIHK